MLISDSHQFIFVHNRKAAGTSIRNRLAPFSLPPPQGMWNKLAHLNPSRTRDYRAYYTTESIDLVARYWRDEIELFGYKFE